MASSHGNAHSEAAKMEQIITEFYAKSLHIILESRTPFMSSRNYSGEQALSSPSSSSSSSSSVRPRDKWFNLSLRECPAALENLDLWRQGHLEPMVVDVILVQRPLDCDPVKCSPRRDLVRNLSSKERYPYCWNYEQEELGCEAKSEKIIERWVVQYDNRKIKDTTNSGSRRSSSNTLHTLYKKSILLLRSLYVTLRLLPAYRVYRHLNSSGQIWPFALTHRVTSLAETFACREEAEMQRFGFTPVDTASGRLFISVLYSLSVSDISSEPSTPMSPQLIPDYVGSPLTDPLKRFPSLPVTGSMVHAFQPSSPFSRRHSWSFDHYRASPPSVHFSPSPTYSEPHALTSNLSSHRLPPPSLPPYPPETSLVYNQNTSFDEYDPSPDLSLLPSSVTPSLPIFIPGSYTSKPPLQSESTAFSEPTTKPANSPAFSSKINLPLGGIRSGSIKTEKSTGRVQACTEKLFFLGKDEARQYSGLKISSSSSSRSFPDDLDDSEFPCPFDVDDDDVTDPGSRPGSFDKNLPLCEPHEPGELFPIKKSQDAAVGALVRMLRKAPPLCQDDSNSVNLSQACCRPETWSNSGQEPGKSCEGQTSVPHGNSTNVISSGGLIASKTTTDALQELQGYREMKNILIGQGSKPHI